jgi:hypothetical protein
MLVFCAASFCQDKTQKLVTPTDRIRQLQEDKGLKRTLKTDIFLTLDGFPLPASKSTAAHLSASE